MSNWETCRLKDLGAFYAGATPSSKVEAFWDGDIAWITPADMTEFGDISQGTRSITEAGYNSCGTHKVPAGSIVMSTRAPIGKVNITQGELCTNQGCKTLVPKGCDGRFLLYLLSTQKEVLDSLGQGTTFKELALKNLSSLHVRIPSIDDQNCIVEYLDTKTAAIDSQISVLEKKRDAYERLKQSVINRAVTRGLEEDVPLKPSGVEWTSHIPHHWHVKRLLETASFGQCSFIDGDWIESHDISDDGIRYLTSGNVGASFFKEQGNGFITEETFASLNCKEVFPGDVLISRLNPPIGRSCIVPNLGRRIVTCVDNVIFRPNTTTYDKRFLVYQMNSPEYSGYLTMQGRGATMKRVSRTMLAKVKLVIPPLSEQQTIANYLDKKCAIIDAAIENTNKQIDAYKRLKRSLINEVVTGQRAV